MPRRPLWTLFATLGLFLGCLVGWGCSPAPLARPAILGASASAGFGCETTGPDGKAYLVDMEAVYQATVPGWHTDPLFLADAGFYTRPRETAVEQMDAAIARNPSLVVAIDYLFWSVYTLRNQTMKPDDVERDRHDALEQALAQLDRFQGPVIVGDLPDMRASVGRMLSARNVPPAEQLEAFNRRIAAWAEQRRTRAPVVILPVASMGRAVETGLPVPTSHGTFSTESAAALLQPDRLHPTPTGLVVILREGLSGLAAQGVIEPDDFRTDLDDIVARLPAEARAADGRREPGLWTLLSVKGKLSDFGDAVEKKDCAKAGELFDEIMEKVTRLKESPHELADLFVSYTLMNYSSACDDSAQPIRRWRDRLDPAIERSLPDPWPLMLWHEFNDCLGDEQRTIDRALRLKRANPTLPRTYGDTLRSAAHAARYTDPAAYLELLPSWQTKLDSECKLAQGIADYWTGQSKRPEWPAEAERNYQTALQWAPDEEARRKVAARRAEFDDPHMMIVSLRSSTIDGIVCLERALRVTGNPDAATTVATRLDRLAGQDEIAPARQRVEKAAAEDAASKKVNP